MGDLTQKLAKGIQINLDAAQANQFAASKSKTAVQNMTHKLGNIDRQSNQLSNMAEWLEECNQRAKWDWATLAAAMIVAAGLAGAGAVYFAKASIEEDDSTRSINLMAQDDDATWCGNADRQIVQSNDGSAFCAIGKPGFQEVEKPMAD